MKYRLDMFMFVKGLASSRERAKDAILEGKVFVDGKPAKPSQKIDGTEKIEIKDMLHFVSRGALKLEKAHSEFNLNFKDRIVLDIGSSTGGFTEIALLGGAKEVIAVDVGKDQLHEKLKLNPKVKSFEGQDIRFIDNEKINKADLIVSDVSFISLRHIFPKIIEAFGTKIECVFLFKPQFECGKALADKFCGVIRDKKIHEELLSEFSTYVENLHFTISGLSYSPITGKSGNIEYLVHLNGGKKNYDISKTVQRAFENL